MSQIKNKIILLISLLLPLLTIFFLIIKHHNEWSRLQNEPLWELKIRNDGYYIAWNWDLSSLKNFLENYTNRFLLGAPDGCCLCINSHHHPSKDPLVYPIPCSAVQESTCASIAQGTFHLHTDPTLADSTLAESDFVLGIEKEYVSILRTQYHSTENITIQIKVDKHRKAIWGGVILKNNSGEERDKNN